MDLLINLVTAAYIISRIPHIIKWTIHQDFLIHTANYYKTGDDDPNMVVLMNIRDNNLITFTDAVVPIV